MTHITQAKKIAEHLLKGLQPHCTLIDVAGSVARRVAEVKDIEICCVPKLKVIDNNDLFTTSAIEFIVHPDFVAAVKNTGKGLKGKPNGRYMQIETGFKINLDLFMPEMIDYYRQLAIRTGPAEYAHKVIANGWRRMGWCGTEGGLRMTNDCRYVELPGGKGKWVCTKDNPHLPPAWKSEREFFEWLNVTYKEPGKRVM